MARTKSYEKQILNKIASINHKILSIERVFGIDSEQYQRYVNAITAALPETSFTLKESGQIRLRKTKKNIQTLKVGQLRAPANLPTAKQSLVRSKKSMAAVRIQKMLQKEGKESTPITAKEIAKEAVTISDQEALQELAAKKMIQDLEDKHGKLKYNEEVRAEMKEKGVKTYTELLALIQEGQQRHEQKLERRREKQRAYYARNKERINQRRRERRRETSTRR